jgi:hypothetical protein
MGYSDISRASLARKQMRVQAELPFRYRASQLLSEAGDFPRERHRCRNRSATKSISERALISLRLEKGVIADRECAPRPRMVLLALDADDADAMGDRPVSRE